MSNFETRLKRYLDTERLLNEFFASFDYCASMCIGPALKANAGLPVTACCRDKYYRLLDPEHPAFDLLRQERHRLYGRPRERLLAGRESPCGYHSPQTGCRLKTHKSPTCLGFLCPNAIEALRTEYGIYTYDYLGVSYALEWILTGDLPDPQLLAFQESILEMSGILREHQCTK